MGSKTAEGRARQAEAARRAHTKHGMRHTREYSTWQSMLNRCRRPKTRSYERYGGRGITVCERWRTFENFLADMGPKPPGMSLDRIDNDGNYEPGNCRWATWSQQNRNKNNNTRLSYKGLTLPMSEWAERFGLSLNVLQLRLLKGWSIEKALYQPLRKTASGAQRKPKKRAA